MLLIIFGSVGNVSEVLTEEISECKATVSECKMTILEYKATVSDYNYLNLPELILMGTGKSISYTYNAAGQKVKKLVVDETTSPETQKHVDYLDGFQYTGEVLQFFPTAEGYVSATTAGISVDGLPSSYVYNYVYNYTDHLGNIRLSYTKDPVTNQLKILEENNYYPFGLKHSVYNNTKMDYKENPGGIDPEPGLPPVIDYVRSTKYNYKYQGQERQDELGLNWDNFKWRNYDYAIGRFMSIDPLSEKYNTWSTYAFSGNRVVDARELEGLEPVEVGKDTVITTTVREANSAYRGVIQIKGEGYGRTGTFYRSKDTIIYTTTDKVEKVKSIIDSIDNSRL